MVKLFSIKIERRETMKDILIHSEGIIAGEIHLQTIHVNGRSVVRTDVPIHFEKHGFVTGEFWGELAEELLIACDNGENAKGKRFFFSGDMETYEVNHRDGSKGQRKLVKVKEFH
jgi:hypothetical protein